MPKLFDRPEFKQYEDRWHARFNELKRRHSYYDGSIYDWNANLFSWFTGYTRYQLYENIRPLYLPLNRAVDIDAGIIPGQWTFSEDVTEQQLNLIKEIFNNSNWDVDGVLYIHYGAIYGTSVLKMADHRESRIVTIHAIRPTMAMLTDIYSFQLEDRIDEQGEKFEYGEVITKESVMTFKDGEPEGFEGREPEYRNELGFIPYIEIPHINVGSFIGDSTYQRTILLLDQVNELASYLADVIKKHSEPQWAILNAEATDLEKSGDNTWFFDRENVDIKTIVPDVDIDGVLSFVREIKEQVNGSLPELSFDELRAKNQIATETVELMLIELILKIKRTRPNYDSGLVDILKMVGQSGLGYDALNADNLSLDQERAILPEDPMRQLEIEARQIEVESLRVNDEQDTQ